MPRAGIGLFDIVNVHDWTAFVHPPRAFAPDAQRERRPFVNHVCP
jgi:hypothetical protein